MELAWDAIVLAGGRGRRLGGVDKGSLPFAGRSLLDTALAGVSGARTVVVVGDPVPTQREVVWARESPAYGGPVAGLYAGLDALAGDGPDRVVVVVAVDMPHLTRATGARLRAALSSHAAAVLADAEGRRQLAFATTRRALSAIRPAKVSGASVRSLWRGVDVVEVAAVGAEALDVDTPEDLDRNRT